MVPGLSHARPRESALLADAEALEDVAEEIVGRAAARDLLQRVTRLLQTDPRSPRIRISGLCI